MKVKKLYLICPDCHIEHAVKEFDEDVYFFTALGSVFDFSEFFYAEMLANFIIEDKVSDVFIVNDSNCTFLKNTVCKDNNYNTTVEQQLASLQLNNSERFSESDKNHQLELLAKLNIYRQAYELLDLPLVNSKIGCELKSVSGLIYNRNSTRFKQINLDFMY